MEAAGSVLRSYTPDRSRTPDRALRTTASLASLASHPSLRVGDDGGLGAARRLPLDAPRPQRFNGAEVQQLAVGGQLAQQLQPKPRQRPVARTDGAPFFTRTEPDTRRSTGDSEDSALRGLGTALRGFDTRRLTGDSEDSALRGLGTALRGLDKGRLAGAFVGAATPATSGHAAASGTSTPARLSTETSPLRHSRETRPPSGETRPRRARADPEPRRLTEGSEDSALRGAPPLASAPHSPVQSAEAEDASLGGSVAGTFDDLAVYEAPAAAAVAPRRKKTRGAAPPLPADRDAIMSVFARRHADVPRAGLLDQALYKNPALYDTPHSRDAKALRLGRYILSPTPNGEMPWPRPSTVGVGGTDSPMPGGPPMLDAAAIWSDGLAAEYAHNLTAGPATESTRLLVNFERASRQAAEGPNRPVVIVAFEALDSLCEAFGAVMPVLHQVRAALHAGVFQDSGPGGYACKALWSEGADVADLAAAHESALRLCQQADRAESDRKLAVEAWHGVQHELETCEMDLATTRNDLAQAFLFSSKQKAALRVHEILKLRQTQEYGSLESQIGTKIHEASAKVQDESDLALLNSRTAKAELLLSMKDVEARFMQATQARDALLKKVQTAAVEKDAAQKKFEQSRISSEQRFAIIESKASKQKAELEAHQMRFSSMIDESADLRATITKLSSKSDDARERVKLEEKLAIQDSRFQSLRAERDDARAMLAALGEKTAAEASLKAADALSTQEAHNALDASRKATESHLRSKVEAEQARVFEVEAQLDRALKKKTPVVEQTAAFDAAVAEATTAAFDEAAAAGVAEAVAAGLAAAEDKAERALAVDLAAEEHTKARVIKDSEAARALALKLSAFSAILEEQTASLSRERAALGVGTEARFEKDEDGEKKDDEAKKQEQQLLHAVEGICFDTPLLAQFKRRAARALKNAAAAPPDAETTAPTGADAVAVADARPSAADADAAPAAKERLAALVRCCMADVAGASSPAARRSAVLKLVEAMRSGKSADDSNADADAAVGDPFTRARDLARHALAAAECDSTADGEAFGGLVATTANAISAAAARVQARLRGVEALCQEQLLHLGMERVQVQVFDAALGAEARMELRSAEFRARDALTMVDVEIARAGTALARLELRGVVDGASEWRKVVDFALQVASDDFDRFSHQSAERESASRANVLELQEEKREAAALHQKIVTDMSNLSNEHKAALQKLQKRCNALEAKRQTAGKVAGDDARVSVADDAPDVADDAPDAADDAPDAAVDAAEPDEAAEPDDAVVAADAGEATEDGSPVAPTAEVVHVADEALPPEAAALKVVVHDLPRFIAAGDVVDAQRPDGSWCRGVVARLRFDVEGFDQTLLTGDFSLTEATPEAHAKAVALRKVAAKSHVVDEVPRLHRVGQVERPELPERFSRVARAMVLVDAIDEDDDGGVLAEAFVYEVDGHFTAELREDAGGLEAGARLEVSRCRIFPLGRGETCAQFRAMLSDGLEAGGLQAAFNHLEKHGPAVQHGATVHEAAAEGGASEGDSGNDHLALSVGAVFSCETADGAFNLTLDQVRQTAYGTLCNVRLEPPFDDGSLQVGAAVTLKGGSGARTGAVSNVLDAWAAAYEIAFPPGDLRRAAVAEVHHFRQGDFVDARIPHTDRWARAVVQGVEKGAYELRFNTKHRGFSPNTETCASAGEAPSAEVRQNRNSMQSGDAVSVSEKDVCASIGTWACVPLTAQTAAALHTELEQRRLEGFDQHGREQALQKKVANAETAQLLTEGVLAKLSKRRSQRPAPAKTAAPAVVSAAPAAEAVPLEVWEFERQDSDVSGFNADVAKLEVQVERSKAETALARRSEALLRDELEAVKRRSRASMRSTADADEVVLLSADLKSALAQADRDACRATMLAQRLASATRAVEDSKVLQQKVESLAKSAYDSTRDSDTLSARRALRSLLEVLGASANAGDLSKAMNVIRGLQKMWKRKNAQERIYRNAQAAHAHAADDEARAAAGGLLEAVPPAVEALDDAAAAAPAAAPAAAAPLPTFDDAVQESHAAESATVVDVGADVLDATAVLGRRELMAEARALAVIVCEADAEVNRLRSESTLSRFEQTRLANVVAKAERHRLRLVDIGWPVALVEIVAALLSELERSTTAEVKLLKMRFADVDLKHDQAVALAEALKEALKRDSSRRYNAEKTVAALSEEFARLAAQQETTSQGAPETVRSLLFQLSRLESDVEQLCASRARPPRMRPDAFDGLEREAPTLPESDFFEDRSLARAPAAASPLASTQRTTSPLRAASPVRLDSLRVSHSILDEFAQGTSNAASYRSDAAHRPLVSTQAPGAASNARPSTAPLRNANLAPLPPPDRAGRKSATRDDLFLTNLPPGATSAAAPRAPGDEDADAVEHFIRVVPELRRLLRRRVLYGSRWNEVAELFDMADDLDLKHTGGITAES
ncbi:hypothetical protein M885DRAFT_575810 [Pelagophyceae sp. CCMP2097]|nr:hypothetical protein M885DRAFT_575810 [Pelagophyceae sp. CCMP2097]